MNEPIERLRSLLKVKAPDDVIIGEFELLNSKTEKLRKENVKLKSTCTAWALGVEQSNTDIVDMQRDEFKRIIALKPDDEIIGICKRAIEVIEQTVPVVVQRDTLQTDCHKLRKENEALIEYATHAPTCPMPENKCDCGLDALLASHRPK